MSFDYTSLPVYEQKTRILETLSKNQVVVIQSPTGSGKTTQIPVILQEADYAKNGMIGITQPRRIAAISVAEFVEKQLKGQPKGFVAYKMRFEDKTTPLTQIKIMTDGILLQELKLDPYLSKYSVIIVDEAHERSLNIDFTLGLLKRILNVRPDFKLIISSATMNTETFSHYFDGAPILTIDTITYPVTLIYDTPEIAASTISLQASEALLHKIESIVQRVIDNKTDGAILCFLPGEKIIKDCLRYVQSSPLGRKLFIVPLYGRLSKEEQELVFVNPPFGKKKLILSTNIAETSVTIPDVTVVIDSGLAKINSYSASTFSASLTETPVSRASCNQRKGRAGRTREGVCYRLFSKKDFETRPLYTTEEIYRTDLSEVVMRMSELGITDFEQFDFISHPGTGGIKSASQTLRLLDALEDDNSLSSIGKLMAAFPLLPRQSRIITEAILHYPQVLEEAVIAASFLSTKSPYILPSGKETEARKAHHGFHDAAGDFVSYIKLFRAFCAEHDSGRNQEKFCTRNFLDLQIMNEIFNVKTQLEQIVSSLGIPIASNAESGNNTNVMRNVFIDAKSKDNYLCCIAKGMIQFICVRIGRENYRSLTQDRISIHPGSSLFRSEPEYIVAGEIVRTSRMFAMSVSPLTKNILTQLNINIETDFDRMRTAKGKRSAFDNGSGGKERIAPNSKKSAAPESVQWAGRSFSYTRHKGKRFLQLSEDDALFLSSAFSVYSQGRRQGADEAGAKIFGEKAVLQIQKRSLFSGEKVSAIVKIVPLLNLTALSESEWKRNAHYNLSKSGMLEPFAQTLENILRITRIKPDGKDLGFIALRTDGHSVYRYKVMRTFESAVFESFLSLEVLIDENSDMFGEKQKRILNTVYAKVVMLC